MHCNDKSAQWWPLDGREGGRRVDLGTGTQSVSAKYIFFYLKKKKKGTGGTSLTSQWLRLFASTAGGSSSILSQGTKIPHTS